LIYFSSRDKNLDDQQFSYIAENANFYCEPLASLISVTPKEKQNAEKINISAINLFEFIANDMQISWVIKATLGSSVRSTFAHYAGSFVKYINYSDSIKNKINYCIEPLVIKALNLTNPDFTSNDSVWTKIEKIHENNQGYMPYLADSILLGISFTSKLTIEIINTYIISTAARTAFASFEYILQEQPLLFYTTAFFITDSILSDCMVNLLGDNKVIDVI
jgi:hypothetical protein